MLDLLNIDLNNNFVYVSIILVLIAIIAVTIISIKKDRDKVVKKKVREVEPRIEPAKTVEEQEHAKLELEKVVNSMKNDLENKPAPSEIMTYEQEQEEKAIISYQELVAAVKKNVPKPQNEIGIEVESEEELEVPISVEEKIYNEELNRTVDKLLENKNEEEYIKEEQPIRREKKYNDILIEEPKKEETKKFHTSEFISPVYGRHPQIELKRVSREDKSSNLNEIIDKDLNETEEFLDSLKEFRNKL